MILSSDAYTRGRPSIIGGRVRSITPGFAVVLALSIAATAALVILALVYYLGSSSRIASDYASIAYPANRALSVELARYPHIRRHGLAAAKADLMSEVKTVSSFDDQLAAITFPAAAATAADALKRTDQNLEQVIELQMRARSLRSMRSFGGRVETALASVKIQVGRIRRALGLPPSGGPLF